MTKCPCCNAKGYDYIDETDFKMDEDGLSYARFICNECGCEFYIEDTIGIIKDGQLDKEEDE